MKKNALFGLIFCLASLLLNAQHKDSGLKDFVRSIERIVVPNSYLINKLDSAVLTYTFLIVSINKGYKVDSVYLTDSAPSWLVQDFTRSKKRLALEAIGSYAKRSKFVGNIIFPIIIKNDFPDRLVTQQELFFSIDNLFMVKSKYIGGTIKIENPILIDYVRVIVN